MNDLTPKNSPASWLKTDSPGTSLQGIRIKDETVKSKEFPFFVIFVPYPLVGSDRQVGGKLQRESMKIKYFWTPAFAGVTAFRTFCETINKIIPK
jgi:hypothetical protein